MMEVRCCCTPQNLLGYLPSPADVRHRQRVTFLTDDGVSIFSEPQSVESLMAVPTIELEVKELRVGGFAYSSDGHSLEEIQEIPGFRPPTLEMAHKKGGKGKSWKK